MVNHRDKERQIHPISEEETLLKGTDDISVSGISAESKNSRIKKTYLFRDLTAAMYVVSV
jgi:hypothetical protein